MGPKISMAAVFVVLAANLLQSGYATTYTVGDTAGWGIPTTNNDDFYDDWADNKNFVVGDVLLFNFTASTQNVVEVTEADYDACSTANAISTVSDGPASITLNRTGDHYFICSIPGHCSSGQKLNVEVRMGTGAPVAPTPRTPTPTPTPSTNSMTYTVGDSTGWTIPPTNNDDFYDDWNDNKDFFVGDVLVFNFTTGQNDVAEVTEADYDSCNAANPISTMTNGPARITLNRTGEHYFICTLPGRCSAGQKLNVEVRFGSRTTPVPTPRPTPTTPGTPRPSPTPSTNVVTYTVGDSTGWTTPPTNNDDFYDDWNDNKDFFVGDVLVFNFTTGQNDVAEVTEADYDSCNAANPISTMTNGPARVTLNRTGEHYFICTLSGRCSAGQKLNVEVRFGSRTTPVPTPRPTPTTPGTPRPSPTPSTNVVTYTVGDSTGWTTPPTNNDDFYDDWNDNKDFFVGDVLVFNFTTGQNDVAEVTEAAYDSCNAANPISTVTNGPARITLNRTGEHYFICTLPGRCSAGQKLNVEVRFGSRTTPVPTPRPSPTMPGAPSPTPTTTPGTAPSPTTPGAAGPTTSGAAGPTTPGTPGATVPGTQSADAPGTSAPPRDSSASSLVSTFSLVFIMSSALALFC